MKPEATRFSSLIPDAFKYYLTAIFKLSLAVVLISGCSTPVYRQKPIPVATTALMNHALPPDIRARMEYATSLDSAHADSIGDWSDIAMAVWPGAIAEAQSGQNVGPFIAAHRQATQFMMVAAVRQAGEQGRHWSEVLLAKGIDVQGDVGGKPPSEWPEIVPAQDGETHGFHQVKRQDGLGMPMVMERRVKEPRSPEELHFPVVMCAPATVIVHPEMEQDSTGLQSRRVVCRIADPIAVMTHKTPDMGADPELKKASLTRSIDQANLPLAHDLTTPLAREFRDTRMGIVSKLAVLAPTKFDRKTGLYMMDPYQPGKIPVVLVHGLASSPMAWKNAYNELAHDPQLASRFQFWLYFYSTGNPILLSAARLRGHLQDARNQFDPEGRDPAMDHIMLVGHSMGGLLTRSAISHSGDQMWQALAKISFDQLQLPDDEKQKMEKAFFFEPVPGVKRAVFMATPHKGSPLGDAWYGRLGSSLVNVPDSVQQMSKDLVKYNGRDVFDPGFLKGRQSSISQLRWENPVLKALHELPVSQSVTYHSIVGLQPGDHPDTGGDGVVPYKSAHIEGAMTELVVPSHHSVQETPAAIVELKRILDEHWSVYKTEMAAMKKNQADATDLAESKPQFKTRPDGPTPVRFAEPVNHASATAPTPAPDSAIQLATEAALESLRR